jgi:hypothetical protein
MSDSAKLRHRHVVSIGLLIVVAAPVILFRLTDRYLAMASDGALLRCLFGFSLGIIGWRCADWVRSGFRKPVPGHHHRSRLHLEVFCQTSDVVSR